MSDEILELIFGINSLLIGVAVLWKLVIRRPAKTIKKWYTSKEFAIPVSAVLILRGIYVLAISINLNQANSNEWTPEDKNALVVNCIRDVTTKAETYPRETKEYCQCTTERITESLTKDRYVQSLKEPIEKQLELLMPLIQGCLDEFNSQTEKE